MKLKHFGFRILILSIFSAFLVFSQAEDTETKIYLTPDDEDNSSSTEYTSAILKEFLENLEEKSGLGKANYTLTVDKDACGTETCIVNYEGSLIWEARALLYSDHLMQKYNTTDPGTLEARKITLDGCLNYSTTVPEYQTCMGKVRTSMVAYLNTTFDSYIQEKLNANCRSLFKENCL